MRKPFIALLTFCLTVNLVYLRPAYAQGQPLKGDLHFLDVKASTSDISAKPATLHLSVSKDGLIQGLLASTEVELEPDVWSSAEEEKAWAEWSLGFEQKLFESWQKRSHTPGQITVSLVVGPDGKTVVENWGTMFPGAYHISTDPNAPALIASPEKRDQFMDEAQDCLENTDKSWLSSHAFLPTKSKIKAVRIDITIGYDGEQFPRHSPLEFGALVKLHKDGSILVACMQGITLSSFDSIVVSGGSKLVAGCSREMMEQAIAGSLTNDSPRAYKHSH